MKRFMLSAFVAVLAASPAFSQVGGFPIGVSAQDSGIAQGSVGVHVGFSDDYNCVALRGLFYHSDTLRTFVDIGIADLDNYEEVAAAQAGALLFLPVELTADSRLALRGSVYKLDEGKGSGISIKQQGLTFLGVYTAPLGPVQLNAGLGLNIADIDAEAGSVSESSTETDVVLSGGVSKFLGDYLNLFAEVYHVDHTTIGFGIQGYY